MSDLHRHRHHSGSHRSREGSHSSHSNGGGALARPRRNYKLISDPSIDLSCSEKQYRFEGVVAGLSPIEDPVDPRSIDGRFVLGAREFPVPRFVYDEFSIGDPPQRDVFVSGINDNLREDDLTKLCQKMGEVHSVQVYYHPERKAHLGGATISFLKSMGAMKALKELNGKKMMGQCLQVQIDDNGEIASDYKKSKLSSQPTLANTHSAQPHPSDPRSVLSAKPTTQTPINPQPLSNPTPLFPPAELLALMHSSLSPFIPLLTSVGVPQPPEVIKDPTSLEARLEKLGMFPVPPTLSPPPPPPAILPNSLLLNPPHTHLATPPPPPPPVASPPAPPPLPKQKNHTPSESKHDSTHSRDRSSKNSSKSNHRKHSPSQRRHHSPDRDRDRDRDRERDRERERDRGGGRDRERIRGKSRDRERGRHRSRERERHYDRDKNREEKDRHRRRSKSPNSHRHSSKRSHDHPPMSHASFNPRHTPPLSHASISAPSHKKSHHSRRHSSKQSTPSKHDSAYQAISDISSDETNKLPKSNTSEHNPASEEQNVPPTTTGEEDMELDPDVSETAPVIELFQPQQKETDLQKLLQQQVTQVPQNVVIQLYLQSLLTALNNAPVQNNSVPAFPTQNSPSPAPPPAASPHTSPSCQDLDSGEIAELLKQPLPPGPISLPAGTMSGLSKRRQLNPMCPVPVTHADNVMNHLLFRLSQELRSVLCKDITRRLIEQTAYKSFEKHWGLPDTRLDIYGPQARKGGSSSGAKSQESVSTMKNDGSNNKHGGSVGVSSPIRAQPPARYKIPLLAGFKGQQRRSLSNMNRMRRPDNRSGVSRPRGGRWRDDEKRERDHGRRDRHRSVSSNEDSPERKKDRHVKPIKRVISSSSEEEKGEQTTRSPSLKFDTSLTARSFSSPSSSSSSSGNTSPSSSSEYSSQSESEHEYNKAESPPKTDPTAYVDVARESSVLLEGLVGCEGDGDGRRDSLLTPDLVPTPLKQKSTSPHEDSDSDTYSPPPPLKVDGSQSWNLNGTDAGPTWFSANDPASWSKDPSFLKKYAPALKRQPLPQTRRFPRRPPWEQDRVRDRFLEEGGFDEEDTKMMQYAFVRLKSENCVLLRHVNYAYHPLKPETTIPTLTLKEQIPIIKRKRTHKQLPTQLIVREHLTGSVRTEGLYRLTLQEKLIQRGQLGNTERLRGWKENFDVIQTSRDSRATQRRLATELGWADINSDFAKNLLRTRKKMLCFAKSTIHNWGLFTLEPIAVDELVIEYIGECIRSSIGDVRERRYQEVGIGCSYMFRVDSDYIIDATKKGNLARFINHSCDPNCYAKIIPVGTEKRIAIYSKRDIEVNEEITYDYKFPLEDEKIPCYCGATTCRGTLN